MDVTTLFCILEEGMEEGDTISLVRVVDSETVYVEFRSAEGDEQEVTLKVD